MQDSEKKRILRLIKAKLIQEEFIFLVGVPANKLTERAQQYVASGQLILVANSSELLNAGSQDTSLVLVHERAVEREVSKLPGKVEFVDLGVLMKIIVEATEARLLTVEREADKAVEQARKNGGNTVATAQPSPSSAPDPMRGFALKFFEEADKDGVVTAIAVKRLASEVEGFELSNPQLVKAGWLEPWRQHAEAKVSGYTATDKLKHYLTPTANFEPGNAFERAQYLVASEPRLRERLEALQEEIEAIEGELAKVEKAKAWLNQGQHFF